MEQSHRIVQTLRVLFFFLVFLFLVGSVFAGPMYEAKGEEGIRVVIHSEPCALKEVTNLPKRATWHEKGQVTEGCAGSTPEGFALFYWADKTVVQIHRSMFIRVVGA